MKGGTKKSMYTMVQHLPKMELPSFDGSAGEWVVDFITKFRDIVHNQEYLNDFQRMTLLLQLRDQ